MARQLAAHRHTRPAVAVVSACARSGPQTRVDPTEEGKGARLAAGRAARPAVDWGCVSAEAWGVQGGGPTGLRRLEAHDAQLTHTFLA